MVNSVVESSMDISGEFCEVHVLQDLNEGCPGDGLESLVVQPTMNHVIQTLIISWKGRGGGGRGRRGEGGGGYKRTGEAI